MKRRTKPADKDNVVGNFERLPGLGRVRPRELRYLDLATGDRKWKTFAATEGKKSLFGQVFIVEQAGRYWLWNDQGELILAKLTPSGYE